MIDKTRTEMPRPSSGRGSCFSLWGELVDALQDAAVVFFQVVRMLLFLSGGEDRRFQFLFLQALQSFRVSFKIL